MTIDAHRVLEASGAVEVSSQALAQLVVRAVAEAGPARVRRPRRDIGLSLSGSRARLTLALAAGYGEPLPGLGAGVQEEVSRALATMCGLTVESVDVTLEELEG